MLIDSMLDKQTRAIRVGDVVLMDVELWRELNEMKERLESMVGVDHGEVS
jgi:hypothetical protein